MVLDLGASPSKMRLAEYFVAECFASRGLRLLADHLLLGVNLETISSEFNDRGPRSLIL